MINKEFAKRLIISYLDQEPKPDNVLTIWEIKNGNDELLLEHIKALRNIFDNAIKEMEGDKNGCNDEDNRID